VWRQSSRAFMTSRDDRRCSSADLARGWIAPEPRQQTIFFKSGRGRGTPCCGRNIFWYFRHPEVYIVCFPAGDGFVSEILAGRSKRRPWARVWLSGARRIAGVAIRVHRPWGVWAHHMCRDRRCPRIRPQHLYRPTAWAGFVIPGTAVDLLLDGLVFGGRARLKTPMLGSADSSRRSWIGGHTASSWDGSVMLRPAQQPRPPIATTRNFVSWAHLTMYGSGRGGFRWSGPFICFWVARKMDGTQCSANASGAGCSGCLSHFGFHLTFLSPCTSGSARMQRRVSR